MKTQHFFLGLSLSTLILLAGCGTKSAPIIDETTQTTQEENQTIVDTDDTTVLDDTVISDNEDSQDSYTVEQVAEHNTSDSCRTSINNNVYDLTDFIKQHPGGSEKIIQLCGKDGSTLFNGQHGGIAMQEKSLEMLKIGTLAN